MDTVVVTPTRLHRVTDNLMVYAVTASTALVHAAGVVAAGFVGLPDLWVRDPVDLLTDQIVIYSIVGGLLVGGLPGYLLARRALVTPLVSSAFAFHTFLGQWLYRSPELQNEGNLVQSTFHSYLTFWPLITVFLIGMATVEYVTRNRVRALFDGWSDRRETS